MNLRLVVVGYRVGFVGNVTRNRRLSECRGRADYMGAPTSWSMLAVLSRDQPRMFSDG